MWSRRFLSTAWWKQRVIFIFSSANRCIKVSFHPDFRKWFNRTNEETLARRPRHNVIIYSR